MKTMELNKMGLAPIDCFEMSNTNGGGVLKSLLKRFSWYAAANEIIEHWEEIKRGLKDGWNFDKSVK